MIRISAKAAVHLRDLLAAKGETAEGAGLRLTVQKGGCAGLQYSMQVGPSQPGDSVVREGDVQVFLAPESLPYLQGCEVDYSDELSDSGFRIHNPNAVRSCGCGTSFEPAAPAGLTPSPILEDGEPCQSEKVA